jgi:hypothetical protein
MAKMKSPERVNDIARPEFEPASDLVEIARQNGEFRKNYGPWLGALLYWLSIKATRPRSFPVAGAGCSGGRGGWAMDQVLVVTWPARHSKTGCRSRRPMR